MRFEYWVIGKTKDKYFLEAEAEYLKRLKKYTKLNYEVFADVKGSGRDTEVLKRLEGELILGQLSDQDYLILLDEKGKSYRSVQFAKRINEWQMSSYKRVVFLTGGAFGFSSAIYDRSNELLSLSQMTFSHRMIRTFFLEQLYRAFTINRGEKYHNE